MVAGRMNAEIRSAAAPRCRLCGAQGRPLYAGLRDRLFGVPGEWPHRECVDARCGLIWLDPMPREEDIHKAYEIYYTHAEEPDRSGLLARIFTVAKRGYLAIRFGYLEDLPLTERALGILPFVYPGRPAELDFSVMWLEPRRRGRLLDVGAGSGWLVEHMNSLGWQAEGLDFDARAVERARSRGLAMHRGGLLEQGFADASFDAVTMSHSIEHVHDPVAWLAEARRILRPGGRLSVATPNTRSLLHRRYRADWFAIDPPRHLHLFNRDALGSALRTGTGSCCVACCTRVDLPTWRGPVTLLGKARTCLPNPIDIQYYLADNEGVTVLRVLQGRGKHPILFHI